MAAIEVSLLFTGRGGTDTYEKHRTYRRVYEVITDDPLDGEQVVAAADVDGVAVPRLNDEFDDDTDAVVVSVECQQSDDSDTLWYVYIDYDSDPPQNPSDKPDQRTDFEGDDTGGNTIDKTERPANPLDEPAVWTMAFDEREEPVTDGIRVKPDGNLETPDVLAWAAHTAYTTGDVRSNVNNVYFQVASAGYSGAGPGPTGAANGQVETFPAWAPTTAYVVGDHVKSNGKVYRCILAGTSGVFGPDGTGDAIHDDTCDWAFKGVPAEWNYVGKLKQVLNNPNFAPRVGVLNSAGLPFDPPVTEENSRLVLVVTKNMAQRVATMAYLLALKNAQNVVPWRGIPQRCAKVKNVTHDGGKEQNGVKYVTTRWEIALDADTFDLRILDAGAGIIASRPDPTDPTKTIRVFEAFSDSLGNPLGVVPLNGVGDRLDPEKPPVFLRFVSSRTRLIDFNLALPF